MSAAASKQESFRVLLVDDSDVDREIAARYLRSAWPFEGHIELDAARNGMEALQKVNAADYLLILLDWRMPRLGGCEFLQQLRRERKTMPVVVLTGLQRHELELAIEPLGASFLNKDELSPTSLRQAITTSAGQGRCSIGT